MVVIMVLVEEKERVLLVLLLATYDDVMMIERVDGLFALLLKKICLANCASKFFPGTHNATNTKQSDMIPPGPCPSFHKHQMYLS